MDVNGLFLQNKALTKAELKEAAEELGMSLTEVKEMYRRAKGMQASGFKFAEKGLTKRQFDVLVIQAKERAKKLAKDAYDDDEDETQTRTKSMGAGSITGKRRNPIATQGYELSKFDLLTRKAMALVNMPVEFWPNATASWSEKEKREVKAEIIRLTTETYDVATKEQLIIAVKHLDRVTKEAPETTYHPLIDMLVRNIPEYGNEIKRLAVANGLIRVKEESTFKESDFTLEAIAQRNNAYKPKKITADVGALFQSTHLNPNQVVIQTKEDERIAAELEAITEVFQGKTFKEQQDNRVKTGNPVYDQFTSQVLNPVNRFG